MRPADLKLTIVRHAWQLTAYPHTRLDAAFRVAFAKALTDGAVVDQRRFSVPGLLKLLECFLALTQQTLSLQAAQEQRAVRTISGFLGALGDTRFYGRSKVTAEANQRAFRRAMEMLRARLSRIRLPSSCEEDCRAAWTDCDLSSTEVEYWSGWWIHGRAGKLVFLNVAPLWRICGPEIARRTYRGLDNYWQRMEIKSLGNSRPLFVEFFGFLECTSKSRLVLTDGISLGAATREFCEHFFQRAYDDGLDIATSIKRWSDWRVAIYDALVEQGFWPCPNPPIPALPKPTLHGDKTHIGKTPDGTEVREKLVTDVPLNLLDDQVIEVLFRQVSKDRDLVVSWASQQATSLIMRARLRKRLAVHGVAYLGGHSKHNIDQIGLENLCATFEQLGCELFNQRPICRVTGTCSAREIETLLGLPGSYDLEPYMYLLIREHPQITDSFLANLTVYDKHGHFVGFERNDAGYTLIGQKKRRGSRLAEQRIELSAKAANYINEVLEITTPLRSWLRARGLDDWRYLFLSTSKGLSKPSRASERLRSTKKYCQARFDQLRPLCTRSDAALLKLVRRLSLTTFRASCGVCVYLETKNVHEMAHQLGHADYRPGLLSHYLPEPILRFFRSRWMRIFQANIICEAMAGSEFLLPATGFASMDQVHEFLANHAFSRIPSHLIENVESTTHNAIDSEGWIYINAGTEVLTLLISIQMAVKVSTSNVNGKARYWAEFAGRLVTEIERSPHDIKVVNNLADARRNASPDLFVEYVSK
jgi:hypothetical protein